MKPSLSSRGLMTAGLVFMALVSLTVHYTYTAKAGGSVDGPSVSKLLSGFASSLGGAAAAPPSKLRDVGSVVAADISVLDAAYEAFTGEGSV